MLKYKLIILLLFFAFLGYLPNLNGVLAFETNWVTFSSCGTPYDAFSNCANMATDDGQNSLLNYVYPNGGGFYSYTSTTGYPNFNIPFNATIDSITVEIEGAVSPIVYDARNFHIYLSRDNFLTYMSPPADNSLTWVQVPFTYTTHTFTTNSSSSQWQAYNWQAGDFDFLNSFAVAIGASANASKTFGVDYLKVKISYSAPTSSITLGNSEASPSGQFLNLDLTGETATVSSNMNCAIRLLQYCSKSGYAMYKSDSSVATIFLDSQYTGTETIDIGGGFYKAFDWGGSDNTWVANNIHVPYMPGWSCTYPYSISCVVDGTEVYYDDYTNNSSLIIEPPTNIMSQEFTEPEPDNPLAWVIWKIRQMLFDAFVPHFSYSNLAYQMLMDNVQSKAPFAYAVALFNMDFTVASSSATPPTITIPMTASHGLLEDIVWTAPQSLIDFLAIIKNVITILLWLLFLLYLFVRIKSVL